MATKKQVAHLRGKLPRQAENLTDAAQAFKVDYEGFDTNRLFALWNTLDDEKADLEARVSILNARISAIASIAFTRLDGTDWESAVLGTGRFSRTTDVTPKTTDKPALLAWFLEHMPDMVSVHYQTLASQAKLAIESGGDLPDGIEVELRDRITRKDA